MDWHAVWLTLRLATCATLALFIIGIPTAYWLALSKWRWKFFFEAVIAMPLVLPPTVLGYYILIATGPHSPLGHVYEGLTGRLLPFSFEGLLIGSILYSTPFAIRPFTSAFAALDHRSIDAARGLGASRLKTFFSVCIPMAWPGILTGIVLSFAHTVGEFGVVLMVGGNIPKVTRTISISLYDDVQALNYDDANRTALALLCFAFLILSITYARQRQAGVV